MIDASEELLISLDISAHDGLVSRLAPMGTVP